MKHRIEHERLSGAGLAGLNSVPRPWALAKTCKSLTLGLATCKLGACWHMPVGTRGSSTKQSSNLLHIERSGQR